MKERSSSTQNNGTLAANSNIVSNEQANSSADPYNSNNFMAPPIGAHIKCVTCLGNNVQGKVIAYDQQTKMLALSKRILYYFLHEIKN